MLRHFDAFATGSYDGETPYFGTRTGSSDASLCPAAIPVQKDMDMLLRALELSTLDYQLLLDHRVKESWDCISISLWINR